jgi:sec-independent protein translocase protein TatA
MDLFAPKHLLLILLIVLLVFGGKKIKTLGSDLGSAFRGFKKAMNEGETDDPAKQIPAPAPAPAPAAAAAAAPSQAAKDAEFPEVASTKPEHASENKMPPRA